MDILWFGIFALLLVGYFALGGFDVGLGILLPILGKTQDERDRIVGAMAPYILANEVWLIAVAGVLFGVFPALEGDVLFGLYPAVVALLVSWVLRDAGLWFRRRIDGPTWRRFWDWTIGLGSLGLALSWGMALAGIANGLKLTALGLGYAVVVAAVFAFHGWTFASWRLPGEITGASRTGRALAVSACAAALPAAIPLAAFTPYLLDHAAPAGTLNVLTFLILPFAPILIAGQVLVWRTFGPRVRMASFF